MPPSSSVTFLGPALPTLASGSDSLMTVFWRFHDLTSALPSKLSEDEASLLISTSLRCIDTLSSTLRNCLDMPNAATVRVVQSLTTITQHLLNIVMPFFQPTSKSLSAFPLDALTRVLDSLVSGILAQIVPSFKGLSTTYLTALVATSGSATEDIRPIVLSFFLVIVTSISSFKMGIQELIGMTIARELLALYNTPSNYPINGASTSISDIKIPQLARKDALWYLCTMFHTVFGLEEKPAAGDASSLFLCTSISETLARLVSLNHSGLPSPEEGGNEDIDLSIQKLDEVELGMVLAVIDKYWFWRAGKDVL